MTGAERRVVPIGGGSIELLDCPCDSDLAPIVLLHEGLGSADLWRRFPADLHARTRRRVIAFSRYGHGASSKAPGRRTAAFFHEEALYVLPELLTMLGVREPVLIGHSDGASIALIHAARQPVSALVLLAPHVIVEELTLTQIHETRQAFVDGDLRRHMAPHHADPDAAFWGWCEVWLDPAFATWSLVREAGALTAPTLHSCKARTTRTGHWCMSS